MYETYCMTCEEVDAKRLEEEEQQRGEKNKNTENNKEKELPKRYKYIGKTCRSVLERASEHQADLRNLSPTSHLLKHILDRHEEEEVESIRFGIRIVK